MSSNQASLTRSEDVAAAELAALEKLAGALKGAVGAFQGTYEIPGLWVGAESPGVVGADPAAAYGKVLGQIMDQDPVELVKALAPVGGWTREAVVYNLYLRSALAWDHDGDGQLTNAPLAGGWRETGTLVKAITLLPYIRSLGCNTIHLLPIAAIGQDGRKGSLGSPYAVRNPYRVEESFAEPALGLEAEDCMAAFVAAAHRLGMRVVVEFVFRTAAPDSDWAKEHPDWFYWIDARINDRPGGSQAKDAYGPPIFAAEELAEIRRKVDEEKSAVGLPAPPADYRAMFGPPPAPEKIRMVDGRWIGESADGRELRVATAFADWPPDDCQPPWTDAAFLRLYDDPDFNYVAYNTIRMYDDSLASPDKAVTAVWEKIVGILPWWQDRFHIDGVMIDMGHALPAELKDEMVRRARDNTPDFAFWDEKFPIEEESVEEGYDAVIGYSWMASWRRDEMEMLLGRGAGEKLALPYFATAESHNSPRAAARPGGLTHSRGSFPYFCALPAVTWIHCGFDLGETVPVNTGLDFTPEEAGKYPAEDLPLFSIGVYDWTRETGLIPWLKQCLELRKRYHSLVVDGDPGTYDLWRGEHERAQILHRHGGGMSFVLIGNIDWENKTGFSTGLPGPSTELTCLLTGRKVAKGDDGLFRGELAPGEVLWCDLPLDQ